MRIFTSIICLLFLLACSEEKTETLNIATAANVQFAMKELTKEFTRKTGITCNIITGSSGKLTAQIKEGAPYDLFLSANLKYPNEIFKSGLAKTTPKVYANGELVLWSLKLKDTIYLSQINRGDIRHIALANPKIAPYGMAAEEVLKYYQLYSTAKPKLVYGESISQVNQFIYSEAADIGFTSKSVVLSPTMKEKGIWMSIPQESYKPIEQGVVIIKRNKKNEVASEKFYKFLFSKKAQEIFRLYGYKKPA